MAGYSSIFSNLYSGLSNTWKSLSNLGMNHGDLIQRNSYLAGVNQSKFGGAAVGQSNNDNWLTLGVSDTVSRKYYPAFDKGYPVRRAEMRKLASTPEIEFILDTIADEAIVYDDTNYFAYGKSNNMDLLPEIREAIEQTYNEIYNAFGFNIEATGWHFFKQWLVDGVLAFEIIYDDKVNPTRIVGFNEIDAFTIMPVVETDPLTQVPTRYWIQKTNQNSEGVKITDANIIFLSYAKTQFTSRFSYIERLARDFHMLRLMEYTRVIWNINNSQQRLKFEVPVGAINTPKSEQILGKTIADLREEVYFNNDNGDLLVNGQPGIPFFKHYIVGSKNGESINIESVKFEGPELRDAEIIQYFRNKLWESSKVPFSRFNKESSGGDYRITIEVSEDEKHFSNFINRLRSQFQELLIKPLYIQMCLQFPNLQEDIAFKSQLGIRYVDNNPLPALRKAELLKQQIELVNTLADLTVKKGEDEVPYFSKRWLVDYFMNSLTPEERKSNELYKEEDNKAAAPEEEGEGEEGKEEEGGGIV